MPLEARVVARVRDMIDHARDAIRYAEGVDLPAFIQDDMRTRAVEPCLEVIGEAARALPANVKALHPQIPWPMMIGMRNILTHEYGRVNPSLVHRTVMSHDPRSAVFCRAGQRRGP